MGAIAPNPSPEWPAEASATLRGEAENILLVDDLPGNLLVYQTILEELGQNLVFARSGEEALKLVLKQEFAVILLDVNMPTMNGFETAALIRNRRKSARTPIIFITAFTDELSITQGYASGAVDYLPTPIVPEVLKAKVKVFIELSQMRRQAALQAEARVRLEAAEESARKADFLAHVSEGLARPNRPGDLLRALAGLPVPFLADVGMACFRKEEAGVLRTEWNQAGDAPSDLPLALSDLPWLEKEIEDVMAGGHARLLKEIPVVQPVGLPSLLLPFLSSVMVLPLLVQRKVCGALVLARTRNSLPYGAYDMILANDLAYRAGVAFENVMLMEKIREADRRKDEFLGMLAHELRNPLGPIYNAVQLLKMLGSKEPRVEDLRNIIDRQAKHMSRLIDDLLDATRLAHGKILLRKEHCDLSKIVRQTAEDYRALFDGSHLSLTVQAPEAPLWVNGDPTRLVQVIGNLLHNAQKFTKPGGTVTMRLQAEDGMAKITVTDTGIGIEAKMLPCVFDIFRQAEQGLDRNQGGLGLGLALVKGLVELHDGKVGVTSAGLGRGAEFTIHLPLETSQEAGVAPETAPAGASNDRKYRILVIEDNRDAAESAQLLLRLEGHEVETAATASAALQFAHDFRPEIILCDIGLPEMDGYQVVRAFRQDARLSAAFVIALTGYGRSEDQQQALEAGFDLHLTKPIDYHSLCRALTLAGTKKAS